MIGYDRPLKPEWIYKSLRMIIPGRKPEEFYDAYNNIAVELTGKDGRRKTRTVLFRTYIYRFQEQTNIIEDNILIRLCNQKSYEYMKPILLSMLIMDYDILRYFTQVYSKIFDPSQEISSTAITKRMTENFGDTEIIKRSARSFLKTLCDFGIIIPNGTTLFHQLNKAVLTLEQVSDILQIFSILNNTKQIDLLQFDESIFTYYSIPPLSAVALEFHNKKWEYISGVNRSLLMLI